MLAMPENEAEHLQSHCMRVGLSIAPAVVACASANTCLNDAMMGFSRGKEKGKIALQTRHSATAPSASCCGRQAVVMILASKDTLTTSRHARLSLQASSISFLFLP
jgi:hypothetical protein